MSTDEFLQWKAFYAAERHERMPEEPEPKPKKKATGKDVAAFFKRHFGRR